MCNVLITSVGRRVELVKLFKQAAVKLGLQSNIVAIDNSETAPGLYFADKRYIVPKLSDAKYIDCLIDICCKEKISAIIPTIDTELLLLSEFKKHIEESSGAVVIISDYDTIKICRNKVETYNFLTKNGFSTPKLFSEEELNAEASINFPLFIKPQDGSSSINANRVDNMNQLLFYKENIANFMVQELIQGQEYSIDAFLDMNSNIISIVPRLRIAVRGGEILKGKIVKESKIIDDVKRLMETMKPVGHITIQLIMNSNGIFYLEINPRFGGGAPMSIRAGANSCENIYRMLNNERLEYYENYQDQLIFMRFDDCIALDKDGNIYD